MDFQFAPWERLTREVVDGDADARVEVGGRVWLYRQRNAVPWVRPLDKKSGEWNFLLSSFAEAVTSTGIISWKDFDPQNLPWFLARSNRAFSLSRIWKLSEGAFAVWNASEWKLYAVAADTVRQKDAIPFELSRPLRAANARSSTVHQRLLLDWDEPESELSIVARYAALSELERQLLLVETQSGTPQEFARLVKATLQATAPHQAQGDTITVGFRTEGVRAGYFRLNAPRNFGVRQRALVGHLTRAFEPHLAADRRAVPSALQWQVPQLTLSVKSPSMHEQLEAALILRAWLQTHWPDGIKHLDKIV